MNAFIIDTRMVDTILALVALEGAGVYCLHALTRRGPALGGFLCNLLAGAFLLVALRNALAGASSFAIAGSLALAFVAHLADLASRWKTHPSGDAQSTIGNVAAMAQARPKAAPSAPARGSRVRA